MASYLDYMNTLKINYIQTQSKLSTAVYPSSQFHYYQEINYIVPNEISFRQSLYAVKLVNTSILLIDTHANSKVYFTDSDISRIIASISGQNLGNHIINYLRKAISGKGLDTLTFTIQKKSFKIKGIPFKEEFNNILCQNPADIDMNGNDLIALINLILEKERTDKNPNKVVLTAAKYIG